MSRDPQLELLNIEPTLREFIQMPIANKFYHQIETDFTAEPWDVPITPAKSSQQKKRIITFKQPITRLMPRQSITETPTNISRPKSCHHKSAFAELGVPTPQASCPKVLQRIIISAQHKSSRKNSTSQYRQKCLKNILLAQKQNSQQCNYTHTSTDYFNFISSINPVSQKNKTTTEPFLKKFKLKLKNMLN
ncbi:unnamed protein product (macronuclear) [Paramecium tetraurelia]|uniref:Uncharacterized protein n=1 Tax=Paramecium tetraurelia TaxID=5888 RepID=A0BND0_PARTE|nr:uncharacterized protein GSPATT00030685001 [Paramecium tetraurelia]CAK60047.1 unnamed protein product [Paramecium tetraurelia]|eukprot:XP_001427445.1 hypothetical protein (macronuclear) [Paramecium tetraurelia strain d4-2]